MGCQVRGAGYLLLVLVAAYILAFIDRQVIGLLFEPIKADLALSDTQLSLLHGLPFALALGVASIPLGRLVDTHSRVWIVALGITLWSAMTVAFGLASGFAALVMCRVGVAIGEATLTPAAHSMIADSVPPQRLGFALGLYAMGAQLGSGAVFFVGSSVLAASESLSDSGFAMGMEAWRLVHIAIGGCGLLFALLVLSVSEPVRTDRPGAGSSHAPSLAELGRFFRRHGAAYIYLKLSTAFSVMMLYGLFAWSSSYFVRVHGWSVVDAGLAMGPLVTVAGVASVMTGGLLSDFLVKRQRLGRILLMVIAAFSAVPVAAMAPLQAEPLSSLVLFGIALFLANLAASIGPAATIEMTPPRMRGVASAFGVLIVNVIGLGGGPLLIGLSSDHLFADELLLDRSLALLLPIMMALSGVFALCCLRPYSAAIMVRSETVSRIDCT